MKTIFFALVFMSFAAQADYATYGAGQRACSSVTKAQRNIWALGYVSAISDMTGVSASRDVLVKVDSLCAKSPNAKVVDVVRKVLYSNRRG